MTGSASTAPGRDGPIVVADEVVRHFRLPGETIRAVDGVSFTIEPGTVVALSGRSGSGKTTLLHLVIGWDRPDAGRIERRDDIGDDWWGRAVVPQGLGLLAELTAHQNVALAARIGRGATAPIDPDTLLDRLDLAGLAHRRPPELSLGEQQRVAVARAVSCRPRLLVADEPTSHQDAERAELVVDLLGEVTADGGAVLLATHDPRVADRTDVRLDMADGRLRPPREGMSTGA